MQARERIVGPRGEGETGGSDAAGAKPLAARGSGAGQAGRRAPEARGLSFLSGLGRPSFPPPPLGRPEAPPRSRRPSTPCQRLYRWPTARPKGGGRVLLFVGKV